MHRLLALQRRLLRGGGSRLFGLLLHILRSGRRGHRELNFGLGGRLGQKGLVAGLRHAGAVKQGESDSLLMKMGDSFLKKEHPPHLILALRPDFIVSVADNTIQVE